MTTRTSKWQFSEEEIRAKLEELGYNNVPDSALKEFSDDLHRLISAESGKESLPVGDYSPSTASTFNSSSTTITTSELTTSHEDKPRYKAVTQCRIPSVHHDEDVGYYQKQLYPRDSQAKQPYPPFLRQTQYIAAEKENHTVQGQDTTRRLAQKRKVLRRKNGKAQVFDESFTNDASATDISDVEQRLLDLPLKDENASISNDQFEGFSAWQQNGMKTRNVLPSFIRPRSGDPSSRGIRKTDPVNRYHQFKEEWRSNKVPGEKMHKNLRWSTREQMLQYETFEKPRRSYVPNNYVAPTDKKRQALRWEVRSTLANV